MSRFDFPTLFVDELYSTAVGEYCKYIKSPFFSDWHLSGIATCL